MRKLTITRKKSFAGAIIPYFCKIGMNKTEVEANDPQYAIKNGETISLDVAEQKFCVMIFANTSTGTAMSKPFLVAEGNEDVSLELVTKYNFFKGSSYELHKI